MKSGEVPQYDEIPYGDVDIGHSGKGQLPQVPADYSEVPSVPQRQGTSTPSPFKKILHILFSFVMAWLKQNMCLYTI